MSKSVLLKTQNSKLKTPRAGAQTNLSIGRDIKGASPWPVGNFPRAQALSAGRLNVHGIGPFIQFDVRAPRIINERDAYAIRIFRNRTIQFDAGGFEFLAE